MRNAFKFSNKTGRNYLRKFFCLTQRKYFFDIVYSNEVNKEKAFEMKNDFSFRHQMIDDSSICEKRTKNGPGFPK